MHLTLDQHVHRQTVVKSSTRWFYFKKYYRVIQKKPAITFKIRNFSCNELKIWIQHNLRTHNSNLKSDFEYLNTKFRKIAIEKSKNGKKSIFPSS